MQANLQKTQDYYYIVVKLRQFKVRRDRRMTAGQKRGKFIWSSKHNSVCGRQGHLGRPDRRGRCQILLLLSPPALFLASLVFQAKYLYRLKYYSFDGILVGQQFPLSSMSFQIVDKKIFLKLKYSRQYDVYENLRYIHWWRKQKQQKS